jgi:hypothetical protein
MASIIIDNVSNLNHKQIRDIFDVNRLGSVKQVTILPEYNPECKQTINKAYILIEEWYDTESAFHFIKEAQTARGSIMHCINNNFCIVKQIKPTIYHNDNFKSKWTQRFENIAKQEFLLLEEEYCREIETRRETRETETETRETETEVKIPLTYDGLMQWHQKEERENHFQRDAIY